MALELNEIALKLQFMDTYLKHEYEIRHVLTSLVEEGRLVSERFVKAIRIQGGVVMQQAKRLEYTSLTNIDVEELKESLNEFSSALCKSEDTALMMGKHTDDLLEMVRVKMRNIDREIELKTKEISDMTKKVQHFKTEINKLKQDADACEEEEIELRKRARTLQEKANQARGLGLGTSLFIWGTAIAFAPLTGGTSMAAGLAAGGINLGLYLKRAKNCEERADVVQKLAEDERRRALRKEGEVIELQNEIRSLGADITSLQMKKQECENATTNLKTVSYHLFGVLSLIRKGSNVVQEFEQEIHNADLEGEAFELIQSAFRNNADNAVKLEGLAQDQAAVLSSKWQNLKAVILEVFPLEAIK